MHQARRLHAEHVLGTFLELRALSSEHYGDQNEMGVLQIWKLDVRVAWMHGKTSVGTAALCEPQLPRLDVGWMHMPTEHNMCRKGLVLHRRQGKRWGAGRAVNITRAD